MKRFTTMQQRAVGSGAFGVTLLLAGCISPASPGRGGDLEPFGAEPRALPRLQYTTLAIPSEPVSGNDVRFEWETDDEPRDKPWASDDEVVQAALRGVTRRVGALQPGVTLVATRIDHDAGDATIRDHTVVFDVCWRGVKTDKHCFVWVKGRSRYMCFTNLCRFEEVPDSTAPILARNEVIERAVSWLREHEATEDQLTRFRARLAPRLEFVWEIPLDDKGVLRDAATLSPQWRMIPGDPLYIDAVTGKVWIDD